MKSNLDRKVVELVCILEGYKGNGVFLAEVRRCLTSSRRSFSERSAALTRVTSLAPVYNHI
jgi:hypothetical protein